MDKPLTLLAVIALGSWIGVEAYVLIMGVVAAHIGAAV